MEQPAESLKFPLTIRRLLVYTFNMNATAPKLVASPCLCNALRQASRAVTRLYDDELRDVGLRTTQYSLLRYLQHVGAVRQRDLGAMTSLDETTLTRNLRPLIDAGWVGVDPGEDRREKVVRLISTGAAKLAKAHPAWERAQERMRSRLQKTHWSSLLALLPDLARLAEEA
jgi:DNA-binding MarR family transcriptional regulator